MTTKNQKLKMALTSTPMILIYVMVVFCLIAAIRQPAFLSPATAINLARAGIFTMCFAICEMVVIISGGMGGGAVDIFNERGVEVIVGVQGEAQAAVETYLRGELISTGSICHQHEHAHECGEHN